MDWSWCIGREQADLTAGLSFHSKFQALYSSPSLKFKFNHIHLSNLNLIIEELELSLDGSNPNLYKKKILISAWDQRRNPLYLHLLLKIKIFFTEEGNWSLHFFFCLFQRRRCVSSNKTTREEIVRKTKIIFLCTWFSPCTNAPFSISRFYAAKSDEVKDQTDMIQTKP